jgi:hypothetical protein
VIFAASAGTSAASLAAMQTTKPHLTNGHRQAPLDRLLHRTVPTERRMSHGALSKPLLGALPLGRIIPQDCHSMMDYANGVAAGTGIACDVPAAQIASAALAVSVIGISSITDYRLSFAKIVPIEVHEVADYAWGIAAIAAPFVFGYWKKAPRVAMTHLIAGAGTILSSLLTDYRAAKRRRRAPLASAA